MSDKALIEWECYEPVVWSDQVPCRTVFLTEEELKLHVLICGSTGCGKTTLLLGAIRQLIKNPIGLLILDAKKDGLVETVTEMAASAGREKDLAVLGPDGTHVLDFFGALRSVDDVATVTQWLMLATERIDTNNNPYWQHTTSALISAALTILASRRNRVSFGEAVEFMRGWFVQPEGPTMPKSVGEIIEAARRKAAKANSTPQLRSALDYVSVWRHLDQRTKSNLQSCLLNVLTGISGAAATRTFEAKDRPAFHPKQAAINQKIGVVSVNALTHPDLAKFLMRLARRQFFDAVQSNFQNELRLRSVLVADEFPLIVQPEDADQLATLRSKGCGVLAATQGLAGLDDKVGPRLRRAIALNFNTIVFMRTREEEVGEFANLNLGTRKREIRLKADAWLGDFRPFYYREETVCSPSGLGRLEPHQGYAIKPDGSRTLYPAWFIPWFELPKPESPIPPAKRELKFPLGSKDSERLMLNCGILPVVTVDLLNAALVFDAVHRERYLIQAREFFHSKACMVPHGLELLPAAWLAGLPGILWSKRKPHWSRLPYMIRRVGCEDGILLLEFSQEENPGTSQTTTWNQIRVAVNRCLYPSRWRPLLRSHRVKLAIERPELRSQLRADKLDFE